ncbi:MAG: glycosyltransferase family 39 protein, partial [Lachnospiraceae bacterium]|nr:glycosyltransferase family 39 protein [Lachnospiraceae bacterium]
MKIVNKIGQFIYGLGSGVVYVLAALIAFYLIYLSASVTGAMAFEDEHVFFIKDVGPGMVMGILAVISVLAVIYRRHKGFWTSEDKVVSFLRVLSVLLTVGFAVLGYFIVKTTHLRPIYDQDWIFQHAGEFLQGDYHSWQTGEYMNMFPFQNGMVLFFLPFARLGENGVFVFQYLNIGGLILLNIGLTKIAREYFGRVWGYGTYIAATLTLQMWGQITFVYGFLWQIAFGIWGIYLMIRWARKRKIVYAVFSVLCLALGAVCKYNGVLFVIAVSLVLFVRMLKRREESVLRDVIVLAALLLCTFGTLAGIRFYFASVTGSNTNQGISMRGYLATGFSESSIAPGWFNDINTSVYEEYAGDQKKIEERYGEIVAEKLELFRVEPGYAMRFFARKTASMWAEPAMQCFTNTSIRNLDGSLSPAWKDVLYNGGIANTVLYLLMDIWQSCLYFGVLLRFFWIAKSRKMHRVLKEGDLLVLFLGGFIYHFLFEAQCYYVLPYFLALTPYALKGYGETVRELAEAGFKKSKGVRFTLIA